MTKREKKEKTNMEEENEFGPITGEELGKPDKITTKDIENITKYKVEETDSIPLDRETKDELDNIIYEMGSIGPKVNLISRTVARMNGYKPDDFVLIGDGSGILKKQIPIKEGEKLETVKDRTRVLFDEETKREVRSLLSRSRELNDFVVLMIKTICRINNVDFNKYMLNRERTRLEKVKDKKEITKGDEKE